MVEAHNRLAAMPLEVMVGQTVSTHDIRALSMCADDPPELIVIDSYSLLAHGGHATDLKHLAVDLGVAVLCSTVLPAGQDGRPPVLDADLVGAADTLAWSAGGPARRLVWPHEDPA